MISTVPRGPVPATRTAQPASAQTLVVLAVSGIAGFHAGFVTFPDWQVVVETAQVTAGLVDYPPGNPFYLYHLELWTVLHHICALLLGAGLSEISLSKIVSGLLGMVSFQALATIVYALSRHALLAIGAAFFVAFTRTFDYGVIYPIYLMGTPHTYGVIGLSLIALVAGLAGCGWYRTSGFLLGIAPAVHPSLGAWFMATVGAAAAWHAWRHPRDLRPAVPFVLLGSLVTASSFGVQLLQSRGMPTIAPELADKYLTSFVAFWDTHRQTVSLGAEGTKMNMGTLTLALAWLTLSPDMPQPAKFLMRVLAVTATLSLVLALASFLPPDALPGPLLILMPGRLVNFGALVAVAVLVGLIGSEWRRGGWFWSSVLGLYVSVGLLLGNRSMLWEWLARNDETVPQRALDVMLDWRTRPLQILLTVAVLLVVATVVSRKQALWLSGDARPAVAGWVARTARGGVAVVLAASAILLWLWPPSPSDAIFRDRTNTAAFAQAAARQGLLVTGGDMQLVQLRTRRPVLINGGGLDGLPYALASGPALETILRDVYAIDFFNPPEEARRLGAIPNDVNKRSWARFSRDEWQAIRRKYNVTQVMTAPDWVLSLPVSARDPAFVLYDIPD